MNTSEVQQVTEEDKLTAKVQVALTPTAGAARIYKGAARICDLIKWFLY